MSSSSQDAERIKEAHSTLYDAGLEMRNKVAGKEYVDTALSNATSDFARPMQEVCKPYHLPLPEIPPPSNTTTIKSWQQKQHGEASGHAQVWI